MKRSFNFFKLSIRPRLIVLFVVQVIIIFSVAGFYLQWQIRNKLEQELGKHLMIVANLISMQQEGEILANILPGDEQTLSHRNIVSMLRKMQAQTAMRRIFIFDKNYNSLADTKEGITIGWSYFSLKLDSLELNNVFQGNTASSVLFQGEDGRLYKSGYAPIYHQEQVIAVVRVEGSARTLESIEEMRQNLLRLGFIAILGAVMLAVIFSNRITKPLTALQASAAEISRGNYQLPIQATTDDEVGFLAHTLEEMRKNIIHRDIQQKAMLAGVAHEIRNPLGGIELFAGLLSDDLPPGQTREQTLKILKEVKQLNTIIQDFLDYARPALPQKQSCSPKDIFAEAVGLLAAELRQVQVNFVQEQDALAVEFDPQHLKQIFLNLLKNSIQAMPKKDGIIAVQIKVDTDRFVKLLFSDNGKGIDNEHAPKIFEPFFTTRQTGIGLGLTLVKSLIEANGGHIELVTTQKKGTTFQLKIPKA